MVKKKCVLKIYFYAMWISDCLEKGLKQMKIGHYGP